MRVIWLLIIPQPPGVHFSQYGLRADLGIIVHSMLSRGKANGSLNLRQTGQIKYCPDPGSHPVDNRHPTVMKTAYAVCDILWPFATCQEQTTRYSRAIDGDVFVGPDAER